MDEQRGSSFIWVLTGTPEWGILGPSNQSGHPAPMRGETDYKMRHMDDLPDDTLWLIQGNDTMQVVRLEECGCLPHTEEYELWGLLPDGTANREEIVRTLEYAHVRAHQMTATYNRVRIVRVERITEGHCWVEKDENDVVDSGVAT